MGDKKETNFKSKKSLLITLGSVLLTGIIFFYIGNITPAIKIDGEKVRYDELVSKISNKEEELKNVSKEYDEKEADLQDAMKVINDKKDNEEELTKTIAATNKRKEELDSLDKNVEDKKKELASLEGKIKEAKGKPINIPAGQLVVGHDVPEGRYKATPIGRGSNFAVYDNNGGLLVNTILSNRKDHGVPEYIFLASDGYIIDNRAPAKLTPVE